MFLDDKHVKIDVGIEIMADMIGTRARKMLEEKDPLVKEKLKSEIKLLSHERDKMYSGDQQIMNKIINVYSKEVKKYYQR